MKTPVFEVFKSRDGWRWHLIAKNNRIIATGEAHTRKADAERAIDAVKAAVIYGIGDPEGSLMRHDFKAAKRGPVINTFCVKEFGKPMLTRKQIANLVSKDSGRASGRNA